MLRTRSITDILLRGTEGSASKYISFTVHVGGHELIDFIFEEDFPQESTDFKDCASRFFDISSKVSCDYYIRQ